MSKKELEYQKIGDFYLPKVSFPAEDEKIENIGKYGLLKLEYLTFLMINGSVPFELRNIDSAANERIKKIIKQLADEENVNEELKEKDQMEWVRCMNNIKNRAEEIVLKELVYV